MTTSQLLEHGLTPSDFSEEYFRAHLTEAQVIGEQNNRYDAALTDQSFESDDQLLQPDLEQLRQLTTDGIGTEQADTIAALKCNDYEPYERLSNEYERTAGELAEAQTRLQVVDGTVDERTLRLRKAADRAIQLAPLAELAANQLVEERTKAFHEMDRQELVQAIASLSTKFSTLTELHILAGTPWPVPRALYGLALGIEIVDEIPLPFDYHESPEDEVLRKLIERHGSTNGASLLLTAYLMKNTDTVFTPNQLGEMLYRDESHFDGMDGAAREKCIRGRIRRLMNPDALVGDMLTSEDLHLQYGYRHFIDRASGNAVRHKRRIYRVVQLQDGVADEFEETCYVESDGTEILANGTTITAPVPITASTETRRELLRTDMSDSGSEKLLPGVDISGLIETLAKGKLLPEDIDGHMKGRALYLQLLERHRNRELAIDGFDLAVLKERVGRLKRRDLTAIDIVMNALDIESRNFKDNSLYYKLYKGVGELLAEHYESVDDVAELST